MTIIPTRPRSSQGVDLRKLHFPVMWTPIQSGVRVCCTPDRGPISTNQKPLANRAITFELSRMALYGLEGDIVAGGLDPTLDEARRLIADPDGPNLTEAGAKFVVRDDFTNPELPFSDRSDSAMRRVTKLWDEYPFLDWSRFYASTNDLDLANSEALMVGRGFDGIYVRSMSSAYKNGASGAKDGSLLALRRFKRTTGRIIGAFERQGQALRCAKVSCEEFPPFPLRLGLENASGFRSDDLMGAKIQFAYMAGDPDQPIKPTLTRVLELKS